MIWLDFGDRQRWLRLNAKGYFKDDVGGNNKFDKIWWCMRFGVFRPQMASEFGAKIQTHSKNLGTCGSPTDADGAAVESTLKISKDWVLRACPLWEARIGRQILVGGWRKLLGWLEEWVLRAHFGKQGQAVLLVVGDIASAEMSIRRLGKLGHTVNN
ncbi:hypothetical protein BHM03_00055384 [Ensete ventricosum]|nr:hypothetical protein BHM03_00055384 [Ensete ventricosum]